MQDSRAYRISVLEKVGESGEVLVDRDFLVEPIALGPEYVVRIEVLVGAGATDEALEAILAASQPTLAMRLVALAAVLLKLAEEHFLHARFGEKGAELLDREAAIGIELRMVLLERREIVVPKRRDVLRLCDVHSPPLGEYCTNVQYTAPRAFFGQRNCLTTGLDPREAKKPYGSR